MRHASNTKQVDEPNTSSSARSPRHAAPKTELPVVAEKPPRSSAPKTVQKSIVTSLSTVAATDATYYFAYVLWITLMVFNSSLFARYLQGFVYAPVRYCCLMLLLISELTRIRDLMKSVTGLFVFALFFYAILTTHETVLLDIAAFVFCSRGRNFRYTVRITMILLSSLFLFIILSAFAGIINNYSMYSGGRMRTFLGFRYALFPAQYMYLITCLVCYSKADKLNALDTLILFGSNFAIFYYTDGRLSYYCAILIILTSLYLAKRRSNGKHTLWHLIIARPLSVVAAASFVLSAALSIILTWTYDDSIAWMTELNSMSFLEGRLSIGHEALSNYHIGLWGREMHFSGAALDPYGRPGNLAAYNTIDCLYVRMFVNYGIVFTALFVALFTAVTIRALKEGNYCLVLILVTIAIRGMVDNLTLHLQYDTFLLLIGMLMDKHANKTPEKPHG